jgi:hypothetical protein
MNHPIDHCPAELAVVAVPKLLLNVDAYWPVILLVRRHGTSTGNEISARWAKIVSTLA